MRPQLHAALSRSSACAAEGRWAGSSTVQSSISDSTPCSNNAQRAVALCRAAAPLGEQCGGAQLKELAQGSCPAPGGNLAALVAAATCPASTLAAAWSARSARSQSYKCQLQTCSACPSAALVLQGGHGMRRHYEHPSYWQLHMLWNQLHVPTQRFICVLFAQHHEAAKQSVLGTAWAAGEGRSQGGDPYQHAWA